MGREKHATFFQVIDLLQCGASVCLGVAVLSLSTHPLVGSLQFDHPVVGSLQYDLFLLNFPYTWAPNSRASSRYESQH